MLVRTHLMFAIILVILFFGLVNHKLVFIGMVFLATIIPDIDTSRSTHGRFFIFRPLQFFVKHRGIIHSFTFAVVIAVLIAIYWPVGSFGFFLGYSVHLICDSFTKEGIQPFWPFKVRSSGPFHTGGKSEDVLFFSLIAINIALFLFVFVFRL